MNKMKYIEELDRLIRHIVRKGDEFHLDVIPNVHGDSEYIVNISTNSDFVLNDAGNLNEALDQFQMVQFNLIKKGDKNV